MNRSTRCPKCGMVQLQRPQCKRCSAALEGGAPMAPPRSAPVSRVNPYAPPTPQGDALHQWGGSEQGLYRAGSLLVMNKRASLPDRCVKCNAPAGGFKLKRALYWHRQAVYLLVLLSPLIYIIVALVVRKSARVDVGLCDKHRRRRVNGMVFGLVLCLASFGGCAAIGGEAVIASVILFAVGLICGLLSNQVVSPVEIDDQFVRLKGVQADFLALLPDVGAVGLR